MDEQNTDLKAVITVLVWLAAFLTTVTWKLFNRLERGCPQCPHCVDENARRDDEKRKKRIEQAKTNLRHLGVSEEEINRRLDQWPKAVVAQASRPRRGSVRNARRSNRLR